MEETVTKKVCKRCEHSWLPRQTEAPLTCPKCSSAYWNRDKIKYGKIKMESRQRAKKI